MTDFHIEFQNEYGVEAGWLPELVRTAAAAMMHQKVVIASEVTILLTDDAVLRQLNRDFRGFDKTTDVLSFADDEPMPEEASYLGDIAISIPQAMKQAKNGGHTTLAELQLLVVHGILHLCGHDHADDEAQATMWAEQAEILESIDAEISAPVLSNESDH